MLLRKLLACLALLTGLTAAGTPAQARLIGVLSAQVEASQSIGEQKQHQQRADVAVATPMRPARELRGAYLPRSFAVPSAPVLPGIDRARE